MYTRTSHYSPAATIVHVNGTKGKYDQYEMVSNALPDPIHTQNRVKNHSVVTFNVRKCEP